MISKILIIATVSFTVSALEFTDKVFERSASHEKVALAPVDLASLGAWNQTEFERLYPELFGNQAPQARFVQQEPGQALFGNGGFFFSNPFMGDSQLLLTNQPSVSLTQPLAQGAPAVVMDNAGLRGMQPTALFRSESRIGDSHTKISSIQLGSQPNQKHNIIQ